MEITNMSFNQESGVLTMLNHGETLDHFSLKDCIDYDFFFKENYEYLWLRINGKDDSFSDFELNSNCFAESFEIVRKYLANNYDKNSNKPEIKAA